MAKRTRVFNLTAKRYLKRNQAIGRVEQCLSVWVEEGSSIRDLTLREIVTARSEKTRKCAPIPFAELPGLIYRASERNEFGNRQQVRLMHEANAFAQLATKQTLAKESQSA